MHRGEEEGKASGGEREQGGGCTLERPQPPTTLSRMAHLSGGWWRDMPVDEACTRLRANDPSLVNLRYVDAPGACPSIVP